MTSSHVAEESGLNAADWVRWSRRYLTVGQGVIQPALIRRCQHLDSTVGDTAAGRTIVSGRG